MSCQNQQVGRKLLCQNCHCFFAAIVLLESIPLGFCFPDWIAITLNQKFQPLPIYFIQQTFWISLPVFLWSKCQSPKCRQICCHFSPLKGWQYIYFFPQSPLWLCPVWGQHELNYRKALPPLQEPRRLLQDREEKTCPLVSNNALHYKKNWSEFVWTLFCL